jgi:uncharacterized membrane protein (UPF0127 family)
MRTRSGRRRFRIALPMAATVGAALFALGCSADDDRSSDGSVVTVGPGAGSGPVGSQPVEPRPVDSSPAASSPVESSPVESSPGEPGAGTGGDERTAGVEPEGFTTVQARVTAADGEVCEVCLWLADSDAERGRGLMGVTDLGAAEGMVFVFDEPTSGPFYMFQTPTPLSIAWFGEDGHWVGAADMEPCLDETPDRCALYSPGGASYRIGIEVFAGDLEQLLLVDGSIVELLEGTEELECQTPSS